MGRVMRDENSCDDGTARFGYSEEDFRAWWSSGTIWQAYVAAELRRSGHTIEESPTSFRSSVTEVDAYPKAEEDLVVDGYSAEVKS
jgi:hypothetical protein